MRLIDADALSDVIKKQGTSSLTKGTIEQFIKSQPTAYEVNKDKWIPCSEQLPENEHYILISFENFSVPCVGRYEEAENGGAFYIGDDDESCVSEDLIVNAWQPLPKPYGGEAFE